MENLLAAKNRDSIAKICDLTFDLLFGLSANEDELKETIRTELSLEQTSQAVEKTAKQLGKLIRKAADLDPLTIDGLKGLFPENFHEKLENLLCKLIYNRMAGWKERLASRSDAAADKPRSTSTASSASDSDRPRPSVPEKPPKLSKKPVVPAAALSAAPSSRTAAKFVSVLRDVQWSLQVETASSSQNETPTANRSSCRMELTVQHPAKTVGDPGQIEQVSFAMDYDGVRQVCDQLARIKTQLSDIAAKTQ